MKKLSTSVLLATAIEFGLVSAQTPSWNSIVRLDPALDAIVSAGAKLELLKGDYFGISEGPVGVHEPVMSASAVGAARTQGPAKRPASTPALAAVKTNIPYVDAKPILEALRENLPAELKAKTLTGLESAWPGWVSRHNAEIRARLERGDEDSIVYLLLFGTTFTKLPQATGNDIARLGGHTGILQGRIEEMVAGIASPGTNERLRFARQVVERKGMDPTTPAGKNRVRLWLVEAIRRVVVEAEGHERTIQSAKQLNDPSAEFARSTLFRDRGLSSDTSVPPNFAIEQALEAKGILGAGTVRRVAIVGPGLDFADKAEAYDFYPQQTIQPFALIDSLIRLGLAELDDLRMTTFDLSPRINQHLEAARQRARAGGAYVLVLPRHRDERWNPGLVTYWERFGDRIGEEVKAVAAPLGAGSVQVRAVRVRPAVVTSITPRDLNIVLQRLEPLTADERFDLIIATNILIYYDVFEQSLALANVAEMLHPGGLFLSNNAVFELPTTPMKSAGDTTVLYIDRRYDDHMLWYQRQ